MRDSLFECPLIRLLPFNEMEWGGGNRTPCEAPACNQLSAPPAPSLCVIQRDHWVSIWLR